MHVELSSLERSLLWCVSLNHLLGNTNPLSERGATTWSGVGSNILPAMDGNSNGTRCIVIVRGFPSGLVTQPPSLL